MKQKKHIIMLLASILAGGGVGRTTTETAKDPQWHTLEIEAYPKKRDDIVFADALTGFYGTGKGKLYRT